MGVLHLWEILQDVKTTKALSDLQGETLAIDLAAWICEAESVRHLQDNVRCPYLRNLFFRVNILLSKNIKMIFVIDGRPPNLKHATIAKRQGNEFGVFRGSRNQLNSKFRECCLLLDYLGIPWIRADGEAEATCATLNKLSYADACVTNDGDVFLYGAVKVYKNFSTEKKNDTILCYEIEKIKSELNLERLSLVALALMLGCDYDDGLHGIGKVQATEFLKQCSGNPIEYLKDLVNTRETMFPEAKKPSHCGFCKHVGTKKEHSKTSCNVCGSKCREETVDPMKCTCDWHLHELRRKQNSLKQSIREKAKQVKNFPRQAVVDEFLKERTLPEHKSYNAKCPRLKGIVDFLCEKLEWTIEKSVEKAVPILTKWIMVHPKELAQANPISILKERKREGVPVYEVEWCIHLIEVQGPVTTLESQELFKSAFPHLAKAFADAKEASQKLKKGRKAVAAKPSMKVTDFFAKKKNVVPSAEQSTNCTTKAALKLKSSPESETDEVIFVAEKSPVKRDDELDDLMAALGSVSLNCQQGTTQRSPGRTALVDVSFDLNFSLGASLLHTPQRAENTPFRKVVNASKREEPPLSVRPQEDKENAVSVLKCEPDSPCSRTATMRPAPAPDSPVFMTLAERLKQSR